MTRRYCWRVGGAFNLDDAARCPECGSRGDAHRPIDEGICGAYAPCEESADHGHPCQLPPGHDGAHTAPNPRRSAG